MDEGNGERGTAAAWRPRNNCAAAFGVCAACVAVLVSAVAFALLHNDNNDKTGEATTVAPDKFPSVSEMLRAFMNPDANPCENFYSFACGSYNNTLGQTLSQIQNDVYRQLIVTLLTVDVPAGHQSAAQKAAALFKTCLDGTDDTAALTRFLSSVGLTASSYRQADALDKILLLFFKYGINTLLGFSLDGPRVASMKRLISITANLQILQSFEARGNVTANYYLVHLEAFGLPPYELERTEFVKRLIDAENQAIIYTSFSQITSEKGVRAFTFTTVRELDVLTPRLPASRWSLPLSSHSGGVYGEDDALLVNPDVMRYFDLLYGDLKEEDLSLLTAWELLLVIAPLTSAKGPRSFYTVQQIGAKCLLASMQAMEVPLLSWHLFREVPRTTVGASRAMTQRIKDTILNEIEDSDWLDGGTKSTAMDKVKTIGLHVGFPKYFESDRDIDDVYSSYPDVGSSFLTPWLTAMGKTIEWQINNHTSFRFSVVVVNAYYHLNLNKVVIPAMVLLPPLFVSEHLTALSYGGLGAIVGHEMTHAFDVDGSHWDGQGNLRDWWTPQARVEYTQRMACLRQSHGLETEDQDGENTADFAGLVSAYNAYSSLAKQEKVEGLEFNAEQLFFIASCIKWCATSKVEIVSRYAPYRERCNVPLKNMEAFARAFSCTAGSPMNPTSRCTFW
ncbi:membrane metallo-endopeptidase-like 1 [Haemaphysalis longicornis]